jgi:hypothetical protein
MKQKKNKNTKGKITKKLVRKKEAIFAPKTK